MKKQIHYGIVERLKFAEINWDIKIVLTFLDDKKNYRPSNLNWQVGNSKIARNTYC